MKLAFIPTAGNLKKERPGQEADRAKLIELGFEITDFDLEDTTETEVREFLNEIDITLVAGGNTFYLLEKANKSGFTKVIKELKDSDKIYIGSSAGSILAGPNVESAGWGWELGWGDDNFLKLKDTAGLRLVNFAAYPHFTEEQRGLMESKAKEVNYPIIPITDEQMVIVKDGEYQIFSL